MVMMFDDGDDDDDDGGGGGGSGNGGGGGGGGYFIFKGFTKTGRVWKIARWQISSSTARLYNQDKSRSSCPPRL
ncbi:hypothetical protein PoB_002009300 [Plakobranchus ocellatus]|uniref:Uncharacterized protein n=1 Tax=Plakobranchus ocellatus TaxID=259542 RepID=A0AAV3ZFP1_9GAST|nr:hypothetical protein PoB_002009300 [Plakobranchus ocellatus]